MSQAGLIYCMMTFGLLLFPAKSQDSQAFYDKFKLAIEDIADNLDPDAGVATVKYANVEVEVGNELAPKDTKVQPTVAWNAKPDKFYTLLMSDPDAPSRKDPRFREWQHWLIVNIPGNDISKGESLTDYIGPGPPKGTGLHRYIFLIFEQPDKIKFDEQYKGVSSMGSRKNFKTRDFVEKYKLPPAKFGNYYEAQWDTSVGS
ncbi:hypothetical protein LSTR_LSTR009964 [Laodelphax striatellus]|uniref:Uncharacterized protein n=1 Tax=Laodelphax striatellus TaxID=195883 RepID=A0A482XHA6_LAOST|nr:hypothetical protein LSTR_LSTR009964 [Laodelphax striatellus]